MRAHEHDAQRRMGREAGRAWWATSTRWSSGTTTSAPGRIGALVLDRYSAGERSVVLVRGDLVGGAPAELEEYVSRTPLAGRTVLELDLAGVSWAGSSAVSALLAVRRWCELRGMELVLSAAQPSVWRTVQAAGLGGAASDPGPSEAEDLLLF